MTHEHGNGTRQFSRRAWRPPTVGVALAIVGAGWIAGAFVRPWVPERVIAQSAGQRLATEYQVLFQFAQDSKGVGGSSNDQITVVFSNRSVEGTAPPMPIFGEDILEEFSFSAINFVNDQLRVSRRVRDKSFLDARYIRVINHGSDGWAGTHISLTVDGEPVLRNVGLLPRRSRGTGGIEKFNPREWAARSYWEAELQPYRASSRR